MESLARRGNANQGDIETRSLLAAGFTHYTSRRNDPQLHTHLLVANATYDDQSRTGKHWYSLEPLQLFRQTRQIDRVFQRELHRHLRSFGLNAAMKKVDKVMVTTLPISEAICTRLSKAHKAILTATALRWNRNERDRKICRAENIINERCRPPKTGLLAARDELFDRALSKEEIREIVRGVGQPLPQERIKFPDVPKPPPKKDLDRLIFDTGRLLNISAPNATELSVAALYAADSHRTVPFQPFYDHAKARMAVLRTIPSDEKYLAMYVASQDEFWHGQVDWFNLKDSATFAFTQTKPGDPKQPDALLPLSSAEPEPLAAVPEPRRAAWVAEALEVRKQLREKLKRERRERLAALAAQAAALEETARRVRVRPPTSPASLPSATLDTSSRSSRPERGGVLVPSDPRTLPGILPGIVPSPSTEKTLGEPAAQNHPPESEQTPPVPLVGQPEDVQPYLPQAQGQREQRPQQP